MATLINLRKQRDDLLGQARKINNKAMAERRQLTDEEESKFAALMTDVGHLVNEIRLAEAVGGDYESWLRQSAGTVAAGLDSLNGGLGASYFNEMGQEVRFLTRGQRLADLVERSPEPFDLGKAIRGKITCNWSGAEAEKRALSEGLDTAGGFLIPEPVSAQIIDVARNLSCILQAGARTVPMDTNNLSLARLDSDPKAVWRVENAAIDEDDLMAFYKITLTAHTVAALVRMSIELLEDAPNVGPLTQKAISQALALELDRVGMFGSGSGAEPEGIFENADVPVISLGTNGGQISLDSLLEGKRTVLDANGTPGAMIYAPRTWEELAKLKDGEGQYFSTWPGGLSALKQLISNQVPINQVQGEASDASCLLMGDFGNVLLGMRTQTMIEATRVGGADTFSKLQVLVRAYLRADFAIVRATQLCVIKGIIPAS